MADARQDSCHKVLTYIVIFTFCFLDTTAKHYQHVNRQLLLKILIVLSSFLFPLQGAGRMTALTIEEEDLRLSVSSSPLLERTALSLTAFQARIGWRAS